MGWLGVRSLGQDGGAGTEQKQSNHKVTAVGGFCLDPKKTVKLGRGPQFFGAAIPQMILSPSSSYYMDIVF